MMNDRGVNDKFCVALKAQRGETYQCKYAVFCFLSFAEIKEDKGWERTSFGLTSKPTTYDPKRLAAYLQWLTKNCPRSKETPGLIKKIVEETTDTRIIIPAYVEYLVEEAVRGRETPKEVYSNVKSQMDTHWQFEDPRMTELLPLFIMGCWVIDAVQPGWQPKTLRKEVLEGIDVNDRGLFAIAYALPKWCMISSLPKERLLKLEKLRKAIVLRNIVSKSTGFKYWFGLNPTIPAFYYCLGDKKEVAE